MCRNGGLLLPGLAGALQRMHCPIVHPSPLPLPLSLTACSTLIEKRIVMTSAACFVDATGQFIPGRKNPLVGALWGGDGWAMRSGALPQLRCVPRSLSCFSMLPLCGTRFHARLAQGVCMTLCTAAEHRHLGPLHLRVALHGVEACNTHLGARR